MATNITHSGFGRVFIQLNPCTIGSKPIFEPCFSVQNVETSVGDITPQYCPSSDELNAFTEIVAIRGVDSRPTASLITHLETNSSSTIYETLKSGCEFDIHVHYGRCIRPDDFSSFQRSLFIKGARLTNYSLSNMVALTPDERGKVDESSNISASSVLPLFPVLLNAKLCLPISVVSINDLIITPSRDCDTGCKVCNCAGFLGSTGTTISTFKLGDFLVQVGSAGDIVVLNEEDYIVNNVYNVFIQYVLPLNVGETITSSAFNVFGTSDGRLFHITEPSTFSILNSPTTNAISAASFNNDVYAFGTDAGEVFFAQDVNSIVTMVSPTSDEITSINDLQGNGQRR